jgi:hypothetical protein
MVFRVGQQLSDYSKREDGSKEDGNEKGNGEGNGECSSNEHEVKERLDNGDITVQFESFWSRYPKPLGKVQAFEKFQASVRTRKDLLDFNKALDNYIASIAGREPQYIKSANNWVSAWREWISYMEKKCPKCGGKGKYTSSSGYDIWCPICRKDEREKAARRHGR